MDGIIRLTLDKKLKELGMSRYELAKRAGIGYQTLDGYYKNAIKRYDSDVLLRICLVLDCEIGEIIMIQRKGDDK